MKRNRIPKLCREYVAKMGNEAAQNHISALFDLHDRGHIQVLDIAWPVKENGIQQMFTVSPVRVQKMRWFHPFGYKSKHEDKPVQWLEWLDNCPDSIGHSYDPISSTYKIAVKWTVSK